MMFLAHVPATLWVHAFSSTTYIINCLRTKILGNKSPYELLSSPPNYGNFCTFGRCIFLYVCDYSSHKLVPQSAKCIFIGYFIKYKGYWCIDLFTWKIYTTRLAQFDEDIFPFLDRQSESSASQLLLTTYWDDYPVPIPQLASS